ncbi:NmrA family transcriptional regulator, partial [Elstera litoralis]
DAFKTTLAGYGMSEAMTQGVVDMMVAKSEGLDNSQPRTAQATSVTSFRQWCMDVLRPILQN